MKYICWNGQCSLNTLAVMVIVHEIHFLSWSLFIGCVCCHGHRLLNTYATMVILHGIHLLSWSLAHHSRRMGLEPASLCPCVRPCAHTFKHEYFLDQLANLNQISSGHHWGGGLAALGFGQDRIRTLVSMATDSSHRVMMGKPCDHSSSFSFDRSFFILSGNERGQP